MAHHPQKVHDYRALGSSGGGAPPRLTPDQARELAALDAEQRAARVERGRVLLSTGAEIPLVGLGTWQAPPGQVKAAVLAALRRGYRHLDCASVYGNEAEVGAAVAQALREGVCARRDLFVTGKLWNDSHAPEGVERACRASLARLGLDYLDLYLIHWPVVSSGQDGGGGGGGGGELRPTLFETWRAMEGLVLAGEEAGGNSGSSAAAATAATTPKPQPLVRAIGVSNLSEKKLRALVADPRLRVRPAVNQVEAHALWRNDALLRCCAELGVHVTAFSPLGSSPDATAAAMGGRAPAPPSLLRHPVVVAAAESASRRAAAGGPAASAAASASASAPARVGARSPAQVLLRWNLERGVSVLPKSVNPERIAANLDVLARAWALSEGERAALASIEPQARVVSGALWLSARGPYKTLADLWDEPGADERQRDAVAELRAQADKW
jgi:diketogulonate reductase-like aldo/keto reductase